MFGIGMPEMILILAVALIVIGPKKLPDLAKSLGKAMGEFKKATRDLKDSMQIDADLKEVKTAFDDLGRDEPQKAKVAAGGMDEASEDEAVTNVPPEAGESADADPMDQLKAAFDRRDSDSADTPAGAGEGNVETGSDAEADSKTHKA